MLTDFAYNIFIDNCKVCSYTNYRKASIERTKKLHAKDIPLM